MTTITQARREIRALGLTFSRNDDGEIRVAWPGNESAAYYTDCPEDALATAQHMAAEPTPAEDLEGWSVARGHHEAGEPFEATDDLVAAFALERTLGRIPLIRLKDVQRAFSGSHYGSINDLIRREFRGEFQGFYPSCRVAEHIEHLIMAETFDAIAEALGDDRRAVRWQNKQ